MDEANRFFSEDPAPPAAAGCNHCELVNQRQRVIWGEGNPGGIYLFILDNPGRKEDIHGKPFLCGTRQTLFQAIRVSRIDPGESYITYLLKCKPQRKYDKETARQSCLPYLEEQIQSLRPRLLILMGTTVVTTLLDETAELKEIHGKIASFMGLPALITYHPLAVRRNPHLFEKMVTDLNNGYHASRQENAGLPV